MQMQTREGNLLFFGNTGAVPKAAYQGDLEIRPRCIIFGQQVCSSLPARCCALPCGPQPKRCAERRTCRAPPAFCTGCLSAISVLSESDHTLIPHHGYSPNALPTCEAVCEPRGWGVSLQQAISLLHYCTSATRVLPESDHMGTHPTRCPPARLFVSPRVGRVLRAPLKQPAPSASCACNTSHQPSA